MAVVASIKAGEQLRVGAIEEEGRAQQRAPGLSIVLIQKDGGQLVAFEPPKPMLDVTPAPAAEPVPATTRNEAAQAGGRVEARKRSVNHADGMVFCHVVIRSRPAVRESRGRKAPRCAGHSLRQPSGRMLLGG
jgi:hypothetical protein